MTQTKDQAFSSLVRGTTAMSWLASMVALIVFVIGVWISDWTTSSKVMWTGALAGIAIFVTAMAAYIVGLVRLGDE